MAIQEYRLGDRTYLFEADDAPEGAELIGEVKESVAPGTFEDLVMARHDKRGRKSRKSPANKQADAPENKDDAGDGAADGSDDGAEDGADDNAGDAGDESKG